MHCSLPCTRLPKPIDLVLFKTTTSRVGSPLKRPTTTVSAPTTTGRVRPAVQQPLDRKSDSFALSVFLFLQNICVSVFCKPCFLTNSKHTFSRRAAASYTSRASIHAVSLSL
jgi:hypothetical protein